MSQHTTVPEVGFTGWLAGWREGEIAEWDFVKRRWMPGAPIDRVRILGVGTKPGAIRVETLSRPSGRTNSYNAYPDELRKPANSKVSYHADNAGGAHGKDTNGK